MQIRIPDGPEDRGRLKMTAKTVHTWKSGPEDDRVLKALKKAKVERNESDRVRAGLRALAREKGVIVPDGV